MRVIFMGTPDFAVGTLEAIVEAGHEVVLAVHTRSNDISSCLVHAGSMTHHNEDI